MKMKTKINIKATGHIVTKKDVEKKPQSANAPRGSIDVPKKK